MNNLVKVFSTDELFSRELLWSDRSLCGTSIFNLRYDGVFAIPLTFYNFEKLLLSLTNIAV